MKKSIIYILFAILFFSACEENMPTIPPVGPQEAGDRVMLIEEFTGVQCVNCPQGSAQIENLLAIYPNNLVAVSLHTGDFAPPYTESAYDFRTDDADAISSFLDEATVYPSAVINRKIFGTNLQNRGANRWPGILEEEVLLEPMISVTITPEYDEATRVLSVNITGVALQAIGEEVVLHLQLTESDIVDVQLTIDGDFVASSMPLGTSYSKNYTYTIPEDFVIENCSLIGFVSYSSARKEVLQAAEAHITE